MGKISTEIENGTRVALEEMPFDRNGYHATGDAVFIDGIWWNEYLDEDNETCYYN